jgi:hypothetical protein
LRHGAFWQPVVHEDSYFMLREPMAAVERPVCDPKAVIRGDVANGCFGSIPAFELAEF